MRKSAFILLLTTLALLIPAPATAQGMLVPTDQEVRIGTLPNGLTYYVRRHTQLRGRADFLLAMKTGAVQEENAERGLTDLITHLCLNGTEHFSPDSLARYATDLGARLYAESGDFTPADHTVYHIDSASVDRASAVDSCLLILRDWARGAYGDTTQVGKVRDDLRQQWLSHSTARQRILCRNLKKLYPDSRYGVRPPYGPTPVMDHLKPATLRAFSDRWLRPDLQSIIVVGDVDPDAVEMAIQYLFDDLDVPDHPAPFTTYSVPDNDSPIYVVDSDKAVARPQITVYFKYPAFPDSLKNSVAYLGFEFLSNAATSMLNERLAESQHEAECPYSEAYAQTGPYLLSKPQRALCLTITPKPGQDTAALSAALKEVVRIRRYGFNATEYNRTRQKLLEQIGTRYDNRAKLPNQFFAQLCAAHYLSNEPLVSVADYHTLMKQFAPLMSVDAVDQLFARMAARTDTNFVLLAIYPDAMSPDLPDAQVLRKAVNNATNLPSAPYTERKDSSDTSTLAPASDPHSPRDTRFGKRHANTQTKPHVTE